MPTRTWPIYKDTLLAKSGSTPVGGGDDEHLPIGVGGAYNFKAALKFGSGGALDWSGVTKVLSARLYLRTTTKVHATSWGSNPDLIVERLDSGNFSENSGRSSYDSPAGGGWSGAASDFDSAAVQPGPDNVNWTVPTPNESTWYSVDITLIVNSWAPASVLKSTGAAGGAQPNYGILVRPNSFAVANTVEFASRKSANNPYIVLTYESNTAPTGPTVPSPASPSVVALTTPTLSWKYDDPQADPSSKYQVQVATDAGFTAIVYDSGEVASVVADGATQAQVVGVALTRGTTYYWRAKAWDEAGLEGAWSSTWNFTVNSLPVVTLTEPSATGRIANLTYVAGSGWASPRLVVAWSFSDAQGQAQSDYELEVVTDSGGSPSGAVVASGVVSGAAASVIVAGTLVENTRYHVRVRGKDGLEWSAWSGWFIVRARWGLSSHRKDVSIAAAAPTTWAVLSVNAPVTPTQQVVVEYNSADDSSDTNLGTWQSSLGAVAKRKFFRYRVWFLTWGTSPAALPSLLDITLQTSGQTIQPERWLPAPISGQKGSIELSDHFFGTQALRMDGDGSPHYITQQVNVEPGQVYVIQGRIRSYGNSGAKVYISDTQNGAPLAVLVDGVSTDMATLPATGDLAWSHRIGQAVWESGARSSVWVTCYINGATGTVGLFDGLKMERGRVTSPWTPGLVGRGVALDSGGVQIDASNSSGAIFRLRTSGGNVIELGAGGLYQDSVLIGPYTPPTTSGTSFPGSPTVNQRFYRTDIGGGMEFFWNGTYWLSTQIFTIEGHGPAFSNTTFQVNLTGTMAQLQRAATFGHPGTDLFLLTFSCGGRIIAGTALSASHKWVGTLHKLNLSSAKTLVATVNFDSGASNTWRWGTATIDALLGTPAVYPVVQIDWTKTGTPGDLNDATTTPFNVKFRVQAT